MDIKKVLKKLKEFDNNSSIGKKKSAAAFKKMNQKIYNNNLRTETFRDLFKKVQGQEND